MIQPTQQQVGSLDLGFDRSGVAWTAVGYAGFDHATIGETIPEGFPMVGKWQKVTRVLSPDLKEAVFPHPVHALVVGQTKSGRLFLR